MDMYVTEYTLPLALKPERPFINALKAIAKVIKKIDICKF